MNAAPDHREKSQTLCGLPLSRPLVMGIVNVTPDSFSDGGLHFEPARAVEHALAMVRDGADILDIGGESTRPGAALVPPDIELARVIPVIEALRASGCGAVISVDTRKASVARAALTAGAQIFNDVSALSYDPGSLSVAASYAQAGGAVCLMHAQGDPATMQDNPSYEDVLAQVTDYLAERARLAQAAGVPLRQQILDPGIGFGKDLAHNIALMRGIDRLQALGAPLLLGVSRKRMIGQLSGQADAAKRVSGSIAAGLYAVSRGAQILRVHDVRETVEALKVWQALAEASPMRGERGV